MSSPAQAKGQHYVFAHLALPVIALGNPRGTYKNLNRGGGTPFLVGLWTGVGRKLGESIPHGGLSVAKMHLPGGMEAYVIELPPPATTPEAVFVAVVFKLAKHFLKTEVLSARYFTLELGSNPYTGAAEYYFCEWVGVTSRQHKNYGAIPDCHIHTFVEAIRRVA